MYDSGKIITGLVIFLALVTFPIWYNLASGAGKNVFQEPVLTAQAKKAKKCVASKTFMTNNHMELLNQWRDLVVRQGQRRWRTPHKTYVEMSLTRTCMKCHHNKAQFCDRCHNYAGITPYCWDCHVEPKYQKKTGKK